MTGLRNPGYELIQKKEAAMIALAHLKAGDITFPLLYSCIHVTKGLHYGIT